jgi:acyl-CoA thioester hydrolase
MTKHKHTISAVARVEVRFNDCDPLGIVWHGNYVKYFEDGREAFGKKYNFDYMEMYNKGFATPIVHMHADFKKPLRYRDVALVETIYKKTDAAKIIFDYNIRNESTGELICTGSTTQVFVGSKDLALSLIVPDFIREWMQLNNL